jgi:hypothetical protein
LKDANGGAVYNQRHGVEMNGLSWIDGAGLVEDNDRKGKWTAKLLKVWDEKKMGLQSVPLVSCVVVSFFLNGTA